MTAFEIVLLVIGIMVMIGSFFLSEKLSVSEMTRIAELSDEEIKKILEKQIKNSKGKVEEMVDSTIDNSMEVVEAALDKETNTKMIAIGEYSDTVLESVNKTHNEIMFLYSMLNDKHSELTSFAGDLQNLMSDMKTLEDDIQSQIFKREEEQRATSFELEMGQNEMQMEAESKDDIADNMEAVSLDDQKNYNTSILELYKQGISKVDIAKELGIGLGEVQLVIGLYRGDDTE